MRGVPESQDPGSRGPRPTFTPCRCLTDCKPLWAVLMFSLLNWLQDYTKDFVVVYLSLPQGLFHFWLYRFLSQIRVLNFGALLQNCLIKKFWKAQIFLISRSFMHPVNFIVWGETVKYPYKGIIAKLRGH